MSDLSPARGLRDVCEPTQHLADDRLAVGTERRRLDRAARASFTSSRNLV
jgi:hypothetical protein